MADPVNQPAPQSATEPQAIPVAVDPNAAPPQVPAGTENRQNIQSKYDNLYGGTGTSSAAPITTVVTQQTVTPQPAGPDLAKVIEGLVAEVQALKAAQPKPEPVKAPTEADWLALLAAGDKEGGENAMAARIKALIGADIQSNAVAQATERINAERQINDFVSEVRSKNADILVMEQPITYAAQAKIQAAAAAGRINSPSDYVAVYKQAVNEEIENARNLILSIRGQGKLEGQTRTSQVLASPTLQPNQVTQNREQAAPQGEVIEDTQGYLARRAALKAQQTGM